MNRLAAMLGALLAAAVMAAPAPRPRPATPWVTGWDKPVDPLGDCRFHREGDKLTITVPGEGHELDVGDKPLNVPRLLRDVEGDFVMQVRLGGGCTPGKAAGILLTDGERTVRVWKLAVAEKKGPRDYSSRQGPSPRLPLQRGCVG
jgi:hypothetical protein